jgi:hypothetical protein
MGVTQKVPKVQKAKWNTLTIAASFISDHAEAIEAVRAQGPGSPSGDIDDYGDIMAALRPFRTFIEAVEGDQTTLASAFGSLQQLYRTWDAMRSNRPAAILNAALHKRFETTADGVLMDLAFALGKTGHTEYAAKIAAFDAFDPSRAAPAEIAVQQAFVGGFNATRDKLVEIARAMYPDEAGTLGEEYDRYIATPDFWGSGQLTRLGWTLRRSDARWRQAFVSLAQLITELPASEAIAERFSSVLTAVFDVRREGSGIDLIQGSIGTWPRSGHSRGG